MRTTVREEGFTLVELLMSTAITLLVLGTAMTTFKDALMLNETATLIADSNQNLRAGTNLLVRDLMQAGRGIPTGGIPIPSGGDPAIPINRPSPPGMAYLFNNVTATTLAALISGNGSGPSISGEVTDVVTMLAIDPTSYVEYADDSPPVPLELNWGVDEDVWPDGLEAPTPTLADDGASLNVGQFTEWISDPLNGVKAGDLLLFTNSLGSAIQTVTLTSPTEVFFEANDEDWFKFNQRTAPQGSIMAIRSDDVFTQTTVIRIHMLTYYVDAITTPGQPRLVRQTNHYAPQALAGVIEDLQFSYDLVDGVNNPTNVNSLPFTLDLVPDDVTFTANQIRKVNLHVGVRSETRSGLRQDYLRHHITTVVSIRSLAFVDRYQ